MILLYTTEYLAYPANMKLRAAAILALFAFSCTRPSTRDMPPIIGATLNGDTARLEQLLATGADPNLRAGGENNWTPILYAVHRNREGATRMLLAHGADPNARGTSGITPLIMASGYGYTKLVRLLLAAGADPRLRTHSGSDALTAAISGVPDFDRFTVGHCQTDTVETLLAADRSLRLAPGAWTKAAAAVAKFSGCEDVIRLVSARQYGRE